MGVSPEKQSDTHSLDHRKGAAPLVVKPLEVRDIQARYESSRVPFVPDDTIKMTRNRLLLVCKKSAPDLGDHLYDISFIAYILLNDKSFQAEFQQFAQGYFRQERRQEVDRIIQPDMIERIILGLQFHDIGKLKDRIYQLTQKFGRPTSDEIKELKRHTGVLPVLDALGIRHPVVRLIATLHHAPAYFGAELHSPEMQQMIDEVAPGLQEGTIPLVAVISSLIDIFDAMNQYRPYRDRETVFWWESAVDQLPEGDPMKKRYSVEREMNNKSSEGPDLIAFFLRHLQRLWPDIQPRLKGPQNVSVITPSLPKDFPLDPLRLQQDPFDSHRLPRVMSESR